MEREVSAMTMLGATLVLSAALMWLVIGTTRLGQQMRDMAYESVITTKSNMETSELQGLMWDNNKIIPRASLYYILSKEDGGVKTINYLGETWAIGKDNKWINKSNTKSCINSYDILVNSDGNLSGKVRVEVEYNSSYGMYELKITEINKK